MIQQLAAVLGRRPISSLPVGVPFRERAAALAADAAAIAEHATIRAQLRARESRGRARLGRSPRPLLSAETAEALRVTRDAIARLLEAVDADRRRGEAGLGRGEGSEAGS